LVFTNNCEAIEEVFILRSYQNGRIVFQYEKVTEIYNVIREVKLFSTVSTGFV